MLNFYKKVLILVAMTLAIFITIVVVYISPQSVSAATNRQMENLDRGVVAVKVSTGVFVSWRMFGTESMSVGYNLYRGSTKVNSSTITSSTNYLDTAGTTSSTYSVAAVVGGVEQSKSTAVSVWGNNYLQVPLSQPAGGTVGGSSYTYDAMEASVGDLDGDHQYEIVLLWRPTNEKDNSQLGYTGTTILDGYELNGTLKWRINLGKNIRSGSHYNPFMVYDLDGDGTAEVVCKTADGTMDGVGTIIGSSTADYRTTDGLILTGPEYLTVFRGSDGKAVYTTNYDPPRGDVNDWGDDYGNRSERYLACIAYLDGVHPSVVMCRGYYTRTVLVAYDWNGTELTKRWTFDTNTSGNSAYEGQGNHNLSVADVDGDGYDEITYGACAIDHNGKGLYTTGLGHGDAMDLGDLNPNRPGLEVWQAHEDGVDNGGIGAAMRDAKTGQILFSYAFAGDCGRACSADLTASYPGEEVWGSDGCPLYSCTGVNLGTPPAQLNFSIWWDGDELRELLYGTTIAKWGGGTLLLATGCSESNTTRRSPCLQADILGDWREEAIWRTSDNQNLRIYTTTNVTSRRIYTLMHDPVYRLGIAWQNIGANQMPHTGFFLGNGMSTPPTPAIYTVGKIDTSAYYEIKNRNSGKNVDVYSKATTDGADIVQWTDTSGGDQQWQFIDAGNGYYKIKNRNSGKLMVVLSASTADGGDVVQWTDNATASQQWSVLDDGSGYIRLRNRYSGKMLDVYQKSTADGGNIVQWTNTMGTNQQWQLVKQ